MGVVQRSGACCAAARAGYVSGRAGVVVCPGCASAGVTVSVCPRVCAVASLVSLPAWRLRPGLARVLGVWNGASH